MNTKQFFCKATALACVVSLLCAPIIFADTAAEQAADAKAGLLKHPWTFFKLPARGGPDWPAQVCFGLPPYPQQVEKAQFSPEALARTLVSTTGVAGTAPGSAGGAGGAAPGTAAAQQGGQSIPLSSIINLIPFIFGKKK